MSVQGRRSSYPVATAGVRDLRNTLSRYLQRVQEGESPLIADHGKPIGKLPPVATGRSAEHPRTPLLQPTDQYLVTLLRFWFVAQTFAPSKATPNGWVPTVKVPWLAPSLVRSLVTLLLAELPALPPVEITREYFCL